MSYRHPKIIWHYAKQQLCSFELKSLESMPKAVLRRDWVRHNTKVEATQVSGLCDDSLAQATSLVWHEWKFLFMPRAPLPGDIVEVQRGDQESYLGLVAQLPLEESASEAGPASPAVNSIHLRPLKLYAHTDHANYPGNHAWTGCSGAAETF